jgi:hypothetical protein
MGRSGQSDRIEPLLQVPLDTSLISDIGRMSVESVVGTDEDR